MSEKKQHSGLPSSVQLARPHPPFSYKRTKALVIGLCLSALGGGAFVLRTLVVQESPGHVANRLCPQAKPITPVKHSAIWDTLVKRSTSDEYKEHAIEWLSGAVRVRYASYPSIVGFEGQLNHTNSTESYDHMEPVGVDPRWEVFGPFHDYLLKAFPLVYGFLRVRVQFLTGFQAFHLVPDQSQHVGFGLCLAWIRRKPETDLARCTPRCELHLFFSVTGASYLQQMSCR